MLPATIAALATLLLASPPAFTGSPNLSVLVADSQGEPLAGVSLQLCPLPDPYPPGTSLIADSESCTVLAANESGRAAFRDVPEAQYVLFASLDGFANTALYPLPIGRHSPVAPSEVVVTLNPVCFDCVQVDKKD